MQLSETTMSALALTGGCAVSEDRSRHVLWPVPHPVPPKAGALGSESRAVNRPPLNTGPLDGGAAEEGLISPPKGLRTNKSRRRRCSSVWFRPLDPTNPRHATDWPLL